MRSIARLIEFKSLIIDTLEQGRERERVSTAPFSLETALTVHYGFQFGQFGVVATLQEEQKLIRAV